MPRTYPLVTKTDLLMTVLHVYKTRQPMRRHYFLFVITFSFIVSFTINALLKLFIQVKLTFTLPNATMLSAEVPLFHDTMYTTYNMCTY